jgi:hypothetical protein
MEVPEDVCIVDGTLTYENDSVKLSNVQISNRPCEVKNNIIIENEESDKEDSEVLM